MKQQEWGSFTVIMNKRGNPCPLCRPFVGKVLIDDVWSNGLKDGRFPETGCFAYLALYAHEGTQSLAELTKRTGFASSVKTVDEAVRLNATDPDSL